MKAEAHRLDVTFEILPHVLGASYCREAAAKCESQSASRGGKAVCRVGSEQKSGRVGQRRSTVVSFRPFSGRTLWRLKPLPHRRLSGYGKPQTLALKEMHELVLKSEALQGICTAMYRLISLIKFVCFPQVPLFGNVRPQLKASLQARLPSDLYSSNGANCIAC